MLWEMQEQWAPLSLAEVSSVPFGINGPERDARNTLSWTYYAPQSTLSEVGTKEETPSKGLTVREGEGDGTLRLMLLPRGYCIFTRV